MEKYKPEKDLPEDIQRLPHGETVCRFCGVSYLVHHEIKRLEDAVESMKGQLKRLHELESQKASWETERGALRESLMKKEEQAAETVSTLQSVRSEWSAVTLRCVQQETQLQEEHRKLQEAEAREVRALSGLKGMQAAVLQLKGFRGHVEELVIRATSQMASVKSRLLQECLRREERLAQDHTQLRTTIAELQEALELEQRRHSELKVETETSKRVLLEQVTRSGAAQRELEAMLAAAEGRVKSIGVDAEGKNQKIDALTKQLRLLNSRVREVEGEGQSLCEERDKQIGKLQARLRETDDQLSSTENTLRDKDKQLRKMKETLTSEKQMLESMLTKAEEAEVRARREMKALKRDHSDCIEQLKSEHQIFLTNLRRSLTEDHAKELQAVEARHRALCTKDQRRLTELKSSLAVAELEHKRVVHELHTKLQKEKSVLDRELSRHLEQVKDLELRLAHEQRGREEAVGHVTAVQAESRRQHERKYTELETKLSSAYQEISALQAVVQRECEEREELLQALADLKAQRTPSGHQRLKHRQTK